MAELHLSGSLIDNINAVLDLVRSRLTPPPSPLIVTSIEIDLGRLVIDPRDCPSGEEQIKWAQIKEIEIVKVVKTLLGITGEPKEVSCSATPSLWMLDGQSMSIYIQFNLTDRIETRAAVRKGFRVCWRDGIAGRLSDGYANQIRKLLGL